jgi:hypothetical protein
VTLPAVASSGSVSTTTTHAVAGVTDHRVLPHLQPCICVHALQLLCCCTLLLLLLLCCQLFGHYLDHLVLKGNQAAQDQ